MSDAGNFGDLGYIGIRLRHQDNRITANPFFLVQTKHRIYGLDSGFAENSVWCRDGEELEGEEAQRYDEMAATGKALPEGVQRLYFVDTWEFVTGCFSEAGAQEYINANAHNLRDPRIYAATLYRNNEMIAIRRALLALAPEVTP